MREWHGIRTAGAEFLLIGAGGLVGSAIRVALAGRSVVATAHRRPVTEGRSLDVTDHRAVRQLVREVRPRIIVVAAAEPYVERCEREPALTRAVNVEPVRLLAEETHALNATLVVLSSEYVFDGTAGPYAETAPTRPLNEYGRQKVDLEALAAGAERHLVCRTSGVFGWEVARKNFVCALIDRLRAGGAFEVPSDQVITPTHAPALGRAIVELADRGAVGTLHVCGPRVIDRLGFAREVAAAFGLDGALLRGRPTLELGLAAERPRSAGLRDAKLRETLGRGLPDPGTALAEMRASEPADG